MRVRKIDAASGLANTVRNECSKASPKRPTGMVPRMSSQAIRWWGVSMRRCRSEVTKPPTMATQSRQKNTTRAMAVATWRPTKKAR